MKALTFRRFVDRLEVVGTAAAVIAFLVFLGLALQNLSQIAEIGSEGRVEAVLSLTEAQYEVQQLVLDSVGGDAHATRQQWRIVERAITPIITVPPLGTSPSLSGDVSLWRNAMNIEILALARGAISIEDAAPRISKEAARLVFILRRAVEDVLRQAAQMQVDRRRGYQSTTLGILISCSGALLCGGFLIMRLAQSLRRARGAEASLRRHFNTLEETVRQRTRDLARTEAQLRDAINTAPDGFIAFDERGALIVANEAAQVLLPDLQELLAPGSPTGQVRAVADVIFRSVDWMESASTKTAELEVSTGAWLMVTLRHSTDGPAVMRFADITPYKRAAKALEMALYREQNLRRLYGDFVGIVSHQFRTPLAIIDSGAQKILRHGRDAPWGEITARVDQIRSATDGLLQLIDATLDSKRMESGEMAFSPVVSDLSALTTELARKLGEVYPGYALSWTIELPTAFYCDPLLVEHAVSNLVSNAAKFSLEGSKILVSGRTFDGSVQISVEDEGVGIPPGELDRIFESAYRAHNASKFAGSGIGLHVARKIARLHGGDIVAASDIGRGTVVTFRLPFLGSGGAE